MENTRTRASRPAVETLEDRSLLTTLRPGSLILPGRAVSVALQTSRPISPANPPADTGSSPSRPVTPRTVSIVPSHISLGRFDNPPGIVPRPIDSGFHRAGLPLVFTRQTDVGQAPGGVRFFAPSQLPQRLGFQQIGGLRLTSEGVFQGQFPR